MKIGIYTPYLDTLTGGELYMLTIAEYLSKNHKVSIFWDDKGILEKASNRFDLNLSKVDLVRDIFSGGYSLREKFLKTLKYDRIIYLSDGSIPFILPKKLIVHFQSPLLSKNVSKSERRKSFLIRKAICNSEFTKRYIDRVFSLNSKVLYPPVKIIDPKNAKKENTILTVGRYQPYGNGSDFKKIGFMLNSFKKLRVKNKNWKMKIITSLKSEYESEFVKRIGSKVDESVEIIKNSNLKEVQNAYLSSKIYWHAAGFEENLEKHPERAEHFGISTVEAMMGGCVPVVINLGGQKEIVESSKNGYLWNNEKELLELTEKVINEEKLMRKLSIEAKKISGRFNKTRFCTELDRII